MLIIAYLSYFVYILYICLTFVYFSYLKSSVHIAAMFSDPDQDNDGEAENDLPPIDDDDLSVPQPPLPQVPQPLPPVQRQPLPDVDMIQMMQMAGGPGYSVALNAADARMPDASRQVPSMRSGGESRRATLKRKAADITRSTSEIFAISTSETLSQQSTAKILSGDGNKFSAPSGLAGSRRGLDRVLAVEPRARWHCRNKTQL